MCGIAGFYLRKPSKQINTNKLIDALLHEIDNRGGEATGMALFGPDGLLDHQRAGCDARVFRENRRLAPADTRIALLHTRLATQGHPAFVENNHPVVSGSIYAVHNGHIANDRALWYEMDEGTRQGEVDSEVIPALIAQFGWENAAKALERFEGSMAIAAVNADAPAELLLAKGEQSPLVYFYTENILVWASTEMALIKAWAYAIGTPPKMKRLKSLKLGETLTVKDGEIIRGEFEVAFDWYYSYKRYNTTGASSDGGTSTTVYATPIKGAPKTVDEWLKEKAGALGAEEQWDRANLKEISEEIDRLRERTNEIMQSAPSWFEDATLLSEFNTAWDRIRSLKELYEDKAWAEIDQRDAWLEDEDNTTELQCPSCFGTFDLSEMTELNNGSDALYCYDCADEFESVTGRSGEIVWKTIAPGTEVMVMACRECGEAEEHLANCTSDVEIGIM